MDLKEVMKQTVFAVVGNTINEEKYAYKIKNELTDHGYKAYGVSKELESLNDVPEEIDIIDLCINPAKGLQLMKDCKMPFKAVVIQPGAESDELKAYLDEKEIDHIESCVLVGLRTYAKDLNKDQ